MSAWIAGRMKMEDLAKIFDVLFNGRPAEPEPLPGVSLADLIKRRSSVVRVWRKYYRFTVEEVTLTADKK